MTPALTTYQAQPDPLYAIIADQCNVSLFTALKIEAVAHAIGKLTTKKTILKQSVTDLEQRPRCTASSISEEKVKRGQKTYTRHRAIHPTGSPCPLHGHCSGKKRLRPVVSQGNMDAVINAISAQAFWVDSQRELNGIQNKLAGAERQLSRIANGFC